MTTEKCRTCEHAFTTSKDRLYCKKSLADKDDCGEYEMTIEALSNSELDKIRSEIADLADADVHGDYQRGFNDALIMAAQIIDKYKADSEDKIKEESEEQLKKLKAEIEKLKAELDYAKFRCTLPTIMDMMHHN